MGGMGVEPPSPTRLFSPLAVSCQQTCLQESVGVEIEVITATDAPFVELSLSELA